jgi:integrase
MPRTTQRPRLWLRKGRVGTDGVFREATWLILDAGKHIATGCAEGEAVSADTKLAEYIAEKYKPRRTELALEAISLADVLSIYVDDSQQSGKKFDARIARLNEYWGGKVLADVTGATCRQYAELRGRGGARRDLEDLRAAIKHHAKEGFHRGIVAVTLPPKGLSRQRWLTRAEAASLLWACWRARERQDGEATKKRPLRHLARFLLIGLYTGTRAGAIATASPEQKEGRSFVDLERGIFYRLAIGKRATNKRQPPAPIPPRLLAHMRRWHRCGLAREHFVEFNGRPVASVKTAFKSAVRQAGIASASPHTLRHTAATWMMQNGAPLWQAAGFLGMSEKVLRETYGHHHPDFMQDAAKALTQRPGKSKSVSLVVSLDEARERRQATGLSA